MVQVLSAGTDRIEPCVPPQATLCNARGARDGPVAEWVLGALLGASTGLLEYAGATVWNRSRLIEDLGAWTVLIIGMGSIGRRVARYLEPLGTRVVGVGSHAHDGLHAPEELPALLPSANAVVILAPLTDATRGLIGRDALACMPDGAVVVNAARGPVVDTDALLVELDRGRLRAVLDVVDPEPLGDDHPLWRARGLLSLTPHIAGDSPAGAAAAAALAGDQLVRRCHGEELPQHRSPRRLTDGHDVYARVMPDGFDVAFAALDARERTSLRSLAIARHYDRGDVLFHRGDDPGAAHVLLEGRARVSLHGESGREILVSIAGPGELLGEIAAVAGRPRTATVRALDAVRSLALPADALRAAVHRSPALAMVFLDLAADRLRAADDQRLEFAGHDVLGRVAGRLRVARHRVRHRRRRSGVVLGGRAQPGGSGELDRRLTRGGRSRARAAPRARMPRW